MKQNKINNETMTVNGTAKNETMNINTNKGFIAGIYYNTLNVDDDCNNIYDWTISRVYKTKANAINWLIRNHRNVSRDNDNRYYVCKATIVNDSVKPGEFVFEQTERKFEEEYVTPAMYKKVIEKMNKRFNN